MFPQQINIDYNNLNFVRKMKEDNWKVSQMYLDHYRIPYAYLTHNFKKKS